ncbi:transposase [Kineobactrum salinum]|uniref:Transposase n=1 Tax=Kineobactrum salinum TaxID=2708301 RepID=A0A6C0UAG3_9GAMM|nr:transposase [Kineobactrum salinum]QIB64773.1 transposase [Kineobactrum salinum]QIB65074.1 transposase [Kineobactrum salinum]QIB65635.1 transposase [Kineobactrum salinum]QIB66824.1 transposase [Kineobactrum salinum]
MDDEASLPRIIKRRRRYSPRFKQRVLAECHQPNTSVAEVALRHGLNLNLVHKWRRSRAVDGTGEFVRLPVPTKDSSNPGQSVARVQPTVSIRLDAPLGQVTVEWPLSEIDRSVSWLRSILQ